MRIGWHSELVRRETAGLSPRRALKLQPAKGVLRMTSSPLSTTTSASSTASVPTSPVVVLPSRSRLADIATNPITDV